MRNISKRLVAIMFAVSLVLMPVSHVFAEDAEPTLGERSPLLDSGGRQAQDGDAVSSWDELTAWMNAHAVEGGTVTLTAPISFDGKYATLLRRPGAAPATLDLGTFGLTVSGDLEMYCPGLTIRGQGGESASLRALPGSSIALGYTEAQPGINGAVLWQDEGSILTLEQPVADGAAHFAEHPVARPTTLGSQVISVMPGDRAADNLPEAVNARVCFQGDSRVEELPVTWDLTGEETAESLAERRRTYIIGEFSEVYALQKPSCTAIFLDRPITFTGVAAKNEKGLRFIQASFTCPSEITFTVDAEYSFDEKVWETAGRLEIALEAEADVILHFYEPDTAEKNELIWDTAQSPTLYMRIRWLDAPVESDVYSDVLAIDGETMEIFSDIGGNRGGGADLDPPSTLPPQNGDEGTGDEGNSSPEPPTPPLGTLPPSGGDSVGGENGSPPSSPDPPNTTTHSDNGGTNSVSNGTTRLLRPDALPIEPPQTEKMPSPPVSVPEGIPQTEEAKANALSAQAESNFDMVAKAVHPEQAGTSSKAAEQSKSAQSQPKQSESSGVEPAQAALVRVAPAPPVSNRAMRQVAAGTAATCGIIALTMTYSHWGGQLAAILRRLLGKT